MITTSIAGNYKRFNFPCGEKHLVLSEEFYNGQDYDIFFEYENDSEIFELLLLKDAFTRVGCSVDNLYIPYFPYSRQDRVNQYGEPLSVKVFCDVVNSLGAKRVVVYDPHSDVLSALVNNLNIKYQHNIAFEFLREMDDFFLVAPDSGALKKIYKLFALLQKHCVYCRDVIECSKKRDVHTGEIRKTIVHSNDLNGKDCVIVDDICDGGRTFIEIAKVLKQKNSGKICLFVTHGFFTKGLGVFDGLIDEIYTRKGRVK